MNQKGDLFSQLTSFVTHYIQGIIESISAIACQISITFDFIINKIQEWGVDARKDFKLLKEKNKGLEVCIMITDEKYWERGLQCQGGEYVGTEE